MPHDVGGPIPHSLHTVAATFGELSALIRRLIEVESGNGADPEYLECLQRAKSAADRGATLAKSAANIV
jgi:hypothetical protein